MFNFAGLSLKYFSLQNMKMLAFMQNSHLIWIATDMNIQPIYKKTIDKGTKLIGGTIQDQVRAHLREKFLTANSSTAKLRGIGSYYWPKTSYLVVTFPYLCLSDLFQSLLSLCESVFCYMSLSNLICKKGFDTAIFLFSRSS